MLKNNLVSNLFKRIPEFKRVSAFEIGDEIYPVFSELGRFLVRKIHNKNITKKSFSFISELLNLDDDYLETLIVLEIFHPIYESKILSNLALKNLESKAKLTFKNNKIRYNNFYKNLDE